MQESPLNPAQRRAVEHPSDVPLLIIAGAGTGKTKTLAHRVAHLIAAGADPSRILLLTFSRRAAVEMARRVELILSSKVSSRYAVGHQVTWAGTFHAIGARLLRLYAKELGLDPSFTIHDRADSADLMNLVRHERGLSGSEKRFPSKRTCLDIYSLTSNSQKPLEAVLRRHYPWCSEFEAELRSLFQGYVEAKQAQNVLDYDDLLLYWAEMMEDPAMAEAVGSRFDYVLVDEVQDTNNLQALVIRRLKPDGKGVTAVGDDAQAIYGFRGSEVENILAFPGLFTTPAQVVTLEENYRSTQAVLDASNAVMALAPRRFAKELISARGQGEKPKLVTVEDDAAQAKYIAEQVLAAREQAVPLLRQAVLFRASHHSAALEIELARRNIPFVKFGGLRFLEAAHVKDVVSVLRFAENISDRVAGFRVLRLLPGIGPATAARILDKLATDSSDAARRLEEVSPPAACETGWPLFVQLVRQLRSDSRWPADMDAVRRWYEPHLVRLHTDAQMRQADLLQLEQIAAGYSTRGQFLTEVTLDPPNATTGEAGAPQLEDEYLVLSTIHSAKGQQWKQVYVLNVIEGCIPSEKANGSTEELEEERRLLHVAMTRTEDDLHLMVPLRLYASHSTRGERYNISARSRFIPDHVIPCFASVCWPPPAKAVGQPLGRPRAFDLNARARARWA